MRNGFVRCGTVAILALFAAACDTIGGSELSLRNDVVSAEGVRSMVHGKDFVKPGSTAFNEVNVDEIIEEVVEPGATIKSVTTPIQRNLIQDRLIAASNQRCNLYKRFIQRVGTQTNFLLGALSTITGGAGAIVTGADTARALSGVAGASSGLRGEFNETYFRSVATHVIVKGIETRREAMKAKILETRRNAQNESQNSDVSAADMENMSNYTAAMAIADAIAYHGACTIMAGLEEAGDHLTSPDDVGPDKFMKTIEKYKAVSDQIKEMFTDNGTNAGAGSGTSAAPVPPVTTR